MAVRVRMGEKEILQAMKQSILMLMASCQESEDDDEDEDEEDDEGMGHWQLSHNSLHATNVTASIVTQNVVFMRPALSPQRRRREEEFMMRH